jgi:hypothetical protein
VCPGLAALRRQQSLWSVLFSLSCNGVYSTCAAKCVQRKCRCTYVKFHRQTAPIGPGHNPRPQPQPNPIPGPASAAFSASSSSRIPISYNPDEFFLGPAPSSASVPSMAEYTAFSFPPLYPEQQGADFTSKYRAQAELLRTSSSSAQFAPAGGTAAAAGGGGGPVGPGMPPGGGGHSSSSSVYDNRPPSGGSSWGGSAVSWGHDSPDPYHSHPQQGTLHGNTLNYRY